MKPITRHERDLLARGLQVMETTLKDSDAMEKEIAICGEELTGGKRCETCIARDEAFRDFQSAGYMILTAARRYDESAPAAPE